MEKHKTFPWSFYKSTGAEPEKNLLYFLCLDHKFDTSFGVLGLFRKGLVLISLFHGIVDPVQCILYVIVHDIYQSLDTVLMKLDQSCIQGIGTVIQCIDTGRKLAASQSQCAGSKAQFLSSCGRSVDSLSQLVCSGYKIALACGQITAPLFSLTAAARRLEAASVSSLVSRLLSFLKEA